MVRWQVQQKLLLMGIDRDDPKFVLKSQPLSGTLCEAIAGSLYKALLYDRSPTFRLVDGKYKLNLLKIKSKLLENFQTLYEFIDQKKQGRLSKLIYEKFSSDGGIEEITRHIIFTLPNVGNLKEHVGYVQQKCNLLMFSIHWARKIMGRN